MMITSKLCPPRLFRNQSANSKEPKKVIIRTSIWSTLHRCTIHVIPISFTVVILFLNLRGYYIGTTFKSLIASQTINLLFLQIAAKAQELLIVASLATIVFHIARHELLFGDGLPLGLVGSGLLFSNLGYFFSKEFLGSLRYAGNRWRKVGFLIILIVSGIIATLTGPATAVLLVPQSQQWNAGSTPFYLLGNYEDFFPVNLDTNATGNQTICVTSNSINFGICPSAGFSSLWEHFGQLDYSNFRTGAAARNYAKPLSGSNYYWPVDSPLSLIPRLYTLGQPRAPDANDIGQPHTFLVQPHAAATVMLQRITTDWWEALLSVTKRPADAIDDREARSDIRSPMTLTRCAPSQDLSANDTEVRFPALLGQGIWSIESNITVDSLSKAASDHLRFHWVQLPFKKFGPASIGAVFESPWTSNNRSRIVFGCTLQASWVNTTLFTDEYSFWSGWYPWDINFYQPYPSWIAPVAGEPVSPTNGRITVTDAWLDMLTPPTPQQGPGYYTWNPSTIESILMNAGFTNNDKFDNNSTLMSDWVNSNNNSLSRARFLETIICSVFEDGLSRAGSYRVFNTSGSASDWSLASYNRTSNFDQNIIRGQDALVQPDVASQNFTKLDVKMRITGYAYQASLAQYLAMSVLLGHLVLALGHTIWVIWRRKTSDSWDSISKIIALAQNSSPAFHALNNTSAGIDRAITYSRKAKIRATDVPGFYDGDHVELVFEEVLTADDAGEQISEDEIPLSPRPRVPSTWPIDHSRNSSAAFNMNSMTGSNPSLSGLLRPASPPDCISTSVCVNSLVKFKDGEKYG
ncbi:hypothetical protein LSUE1_G008647 [Lachnellula suecica]|uniref:Uncharacterized protein n=1 Tax=Lachnellula suecica TaxID=602035 RepID=A0A8T9C5P1_9HELO|nr:hypothetical protein LSUE1_G008647 [Lachnellula suecica]